MNFSQIIKQMGWPFTIVYFALILGALYFSFVAAPKAINSNDWPQVQGKVSHSDIIKNQRRNKTGVRITVYSANIHFQYVVDGMPYTANEVKFAQHNRSSEIEQAINTQYAAGSNVTVFYNPTNPSEAVLQKGLGVKYILTGCFLLGGIGVMAWALYRNAKKRRL